MSMVDAIVTSLVKNVSELLVKETSLILNARDEVESLQGELRFIREFLRHSEGKREEVKEEAKQIQDVALEAENFLDEFVIKMAKYTRRNRLMRTLHVGEKTILLRNVAVQIQNINKKLNKIHASKDKYNLTSHESKISERDVIQSRRRNVEEDEVVGFDNHAEKVTKMLDTSDSRRDFVSIVGMGGLGKTTLAKKIYNGKFVKRSFDCRAWVDVSQDYNRKDLLMKISESVFPPTKMLEVEKLTEDKLVEELRTELESMRYMIVFDDVWDKHLWNAIKAAFPDNGKRSRLLLTTRLNEVALLASVRTPPHFLPFLDEYNSWKLFSKKVFHEQVCPPLLEKLARQQILPKCKGLPLAIVVAAGLFRNREESMWSKMVAGLDWYLAQNPTECLGILALSYDDLPPQLKPCFLYFGVYPEDFDIHVRKLIRLWIAEGFIEEKSSSSLDMEDIAEEYLLQLIDRNLVQVARRRTDGGVKSCRIHDLLRDLSILEGKKEKFLMVDRNSNRSPLASNNPIIIKRLSVHYGSRELRYDYLSMPEFSRLHSILAFGDKALSMNAFDEDPFSRLSKFCQYLRVLDIDATREYKSPPKVEMLVQLRYWRMKSCTELNSILLPISKLDNLQTLDLVGSGGQTTYYTNAANVWEMHQLRHLLLSGNYRIAKIKGNNALPNLRSLSTLDLHYKYKAKKMLKRLPNLKKLKIVCRDNEIAIFECLEELQRLQTLNIGGRFEFTDLRKLPLSLTKITFHDSYLQSSAFEELGTLPNLQVLKLKENSLGFKDNSPGRRKLDYRSNRGEFRQLRFLGFYNLNIEMWSMQGQGLQSLVYLNIEKCDSLKAIPEQLKQLITLRELNINLCMSLENSEELKAIWRYDPRLHITSSLVYNLKQRNKMRGQWRTSSGD